MPDDKPCKKPVNEWSDWQVSEALRLRKQGLSMSETGKIIGKSRSAVARKMNRMNGPESPEQIAARRNAAKAAKKSINSRKSWLAKKVSHKPLDRDNPDQTGPLGPIRNVSFRVIAEANAGMCQWPMAKGKTKSDVYCGRRIKRGLRHPYCFEHFQISWKPVDGLEKAR